MAQRQARRLVSAPPGLALVGERVSAAVNSFLDAERTRWSAVDPDLDAPLRALQDFVGAGGKRLRPAFCYWSFVGGGGDPDDETAMQACAALELLHTFALVHDDIMDGSARRRGRAAVHAAFTAEHEAGGWRGEARRFGDGAAILIGDLAFVYADQLLRPVSQDAHDVFDDLRLELCAGQYLDLAGTARGKRDSARAARIERYKSGKYTVERPLHLGAALVGRLQELAPALSAFGLPLGDAFQMRDDVLGIFGDADATGKPVGDDLREGKLTPLLAIAVDRIGERGVLGRVGAPDLTEPEIGAMQRTIVECGALEETEHMIERRASEAVAALAALPIASDAKTALEELATYVAWRSS